MYRLILFLLGDVVEEFSSATKLHDQEEILGRLDDLVQLYQIGMPDQFKDVNLP